MKGWIGLERLKFYAFHGVYDYEQEKGNNFTLDIKVFADVSDSAKNDDLTSTINYEDLYTICKEEMAIPSKLLENVAYRIIQRIKSEVSNVEKVDLRVLKEEPPIGGECKGSFFHVIY